jgi:hypothetical protein
MPGDQRERASQKRSLRLHETARILRRAEERSSTSQMHQFEGARDYWESRKYTIRDEEYLVIAQATLLCLPGTVLRDTLLHLL